MRILFFLFFLPKKKLSFSYILRAQKAPHHSAHSSSVNMSRKRLAGGYLPHEEKPVCIKHTTSLECRCNYDLLHFHVQFRIRVRPHMHMRIRSRTRKHNHARKLTQAHLQAHANMHEYKHTHTSTRIQARIQAHTHTHAPAQTHHMHTYTHSNMYTHSHNQSEHSPVDIIGGSWHKIAVPSQHLIEIFDRPKHRPSSNNVDRVTAKQERRDDSEIAATTTKCPQKVCVLVLQ